MFKLDREEFDTLIGDAFDLKVTYLIHVCETMEKIITLVSRCGRGLWIPMSPLV